MGILYRDKIFVISTPKLLSCSESYLKQADSKINEIDSKQGSYTQTSKRILGLTTEGGNQINYIDKSNNTPLIHQDFYG